MPVPRNQVISEKSNDRVEDDVYSRLSEDLMQYTDPLPRKEWLRIIIELNQCFMKDAEKLLLGLIEHGVLRWQRIYAGQPIYVHSHTPSWHHDKRPVVIAED